MSQGPAIQRFVISDANGNKLVITPIGEERTADVDVRRVAEYQQLLQESYTINIALMFDPTSGRYNAPEIR